MSRLSSLTREVEFLDVRKYYGPSPMTQEVLGWPPRA